MTSDVKPVGQDRESWPHLGRIFTGAPDAKIALHLAFFFCILFAIGLRLFQLGTQNFWYDEAETIGYATRLFPIRDIHPPTYYAVVHLAMNLGGSEFWVRLPSFVMGVASMVVVYAIGRLLVSNPVTLIALLLTSLSPILVWHAQDARMYSQLLLGCLLTIYFYVQILRRGNTLDWVGYVAAALFAAYTQLYATLLIVTLSGHLLLFHRRLFLRWMVVQWAVLLGYLPWLIFLVTMPPEQIGGTPNRTLLAFPYTYFAFTNGYSLGPSILELRDFGAETLLLYLPLLLPICLTVVLLTVAGVRRLWRANRDAASLIVLWAVVPVLVAVAVPFVVRSMTYNVRYVLFSVPAYLFILAAGVVSLKRYRIGVALLLVVILFNGISLYNYFYVAHYAKEDVRSAAAYVAANAKPDDPIVVVTVERLFRWYFKADNVIVSNHDILADAVRNTQTVWLVESRPWQSDPKRIVRQSLDSQYPVVIQMTFPGVEVIQYCIHGCPPV